MNTYHITVGTYGTRLHGGQAPTVALPQNRVGDPFVSFDPSLWLWRRDSMIQEPTYLTEEQRLFLEGVISNICERGGWLLHHFACQRDHFHLLLSSESDPKQIRRWVKTWFTQALNEKFGKKKWFADYGSTKWINDENYYQAVVEYILQQRASG